MIFSPHDSPFILVCTADARSVGNSQLSCLKPHFAFPWVRPWDNRGKCYMGRKRIQCLSNASQQNTSIFNRLRAIARDWAEIATFFLTPLHLTPPFGVFPLEFWGNVWSSKTRIIGLPGSEDSLTIG